MILYVSLFSGNVGSGRVKKNTLFGKGLPASGGKIQWPSTWGKKTHLRDVVVQLVQRIQQRSQMGLQQNQASSFLNLQVKKVDITKSKLPVTWNGSSLKKQHVIFKWHGKNTPSFVCLGVQNLTKRLQVSFGDESCKGDSCYVFLHPDNPHKFRPFVCLKLFFWKAFQVQEKWPSLVSPLFWAVFHGCFFIGFVSTRNMSNKKPSHFWYPKKWDQFQQ